MVGLPVESYGLLGRNERGGNGAELTSSRTFLHERQPRLLVSHRANPANPDPKSSTLAGNGTGVTPDA